MRPAALAVNDLDRPLHIVARMDPSTEQDYTLTYIDISRASLGRETKNTGIGGERVLQELEDDPLS